MSTVTTSSSAAPSLPPMAVTATRSSPTVPNPQPSSSPSDVTVTQIQQPPSPLTNNTPDTPRLTILSHDNQDSSISLGNKDTDLKQKLDDVWTKLKTLTHSKGTNPEIRTFTGKNGNEIAVAIYYTDSDGKRQPLVIQPSDSEHSDYLILKDKMRELHKELVGIPTQMEPFQGIHIPKFKNNFLYFFQNGYFDKMNHFIQNKGLKKKLSPHLVFARIAAAQVWMGIALSGIGALIDQKKTNIKTLAQSPTADDRKKLAKEKVQLTELQSVFNDLIEMSQNTSSPRPQRLMLNWVIGMHDTLNDFDRAKLTQEGLLITLTEEDANIAKESSFNPRSGHFNPFGKKGINSLPIEDRREYSHSAAALTLYHDEPQYMRWCDHFGRHMKSDSTARLVIAHILNALASSAPQKAGSSLLSGNHISCNNELTTIFDNATQEAQKLYPKITFNAAASGANQTWQDWVSLPELKPFLN